MSGAGTSTETASDSETVEQRLDALESRVGELERENKQLREELEDERAMRKALIDTNDDVDPAEIAFGNVLVGRAPLEGMFKSRKTDFDALSEYIFGDDSMNTDEEIEAHIEQNGTLPDQLEDGKLRVTHGGLTEAVRQRLLPIHEMWIDVREEREEKIPSANEQRAARLFGRFIRKAAGEHSVGVDASYNTYSMDSASAREILTAAGDMTQSGKSMTVKRAMKATQRLSKRDPCDCDDLEDCDHGVLVWQNDGGHELAVNKERFNALMSDVEAAINGAVGGGDTTADDEGEPSEAQDQDSTSAFDQLDDATHVTSDEDDSVQGEVANSVVSHRDGPALDAEDAPTHDT